MSSTIKRGGPGTYRWTGAAGSSARIGGPMTPQLASHASARVRSAGHQVRKELNAGLLTVTDALEDPRAGVLTIGALLASPRWRGPKRANMLCARLNIMPTRRVRDLTDRQKRVIREALAR